MDTYAIINILFETNNAAVSFHDTIYEATDVSYSTEELKKIFLSLPIHIQHTAFEWGLGDTGFRDEAYTYIMEQKNGKNETTIN